MDIKKLDAELIDILNTFNGKADSIVNGFSNNNPELKLIKLAECTSNALNGYRESIIKYLSEKK